MESFFPIWPVSLAGAQTFSLQAVSNAIDFKPAPLPLVLNPKGVESITAGFELNSTPLIPDTKGRKSTNTRFELGYLLLGPDAKRRAGASTRFELGSTHLRLGAQRVQSLPMMFGVYIQRSQPHPTKRTRPNTFL